MDQADIPPYLDGLNEAQRDAVLQTKGPVMIIAGAGSGKTRVLTYRIAHLLRQGENSFEILALTFTNKAAKEMRERIESVVGPEARNIWMGTFHSIFAKILRVEAEHLNYPSNFTIYDADDSKSLVKSIIKEMNLDDKTYKPNMIFSRISMAKNNLITAEKYAETSELTSDDDQSGRTYFHHIYKRYSDRCKKAGAMDFDDLLLNTFKLFQNHPKVLYKYQHKFKFVMVDEYQDTNLCQYMIVKKLASVNENICVVGDDAQSIYSFRGANIQNILNFEKDYPDLKVFKLEQNYRSSKTIVKAAGSVIQYNKEQISKEVWTSNDGGEKIKVIKAGSDNEEGKIIAQEIFKNSMEHREPYSSFSILYRTNAQSRAFEEALRKLNIPYKIYGGLSFYQRKEVKDLLAYLRVVNNPRDEEALKRIINYPTRTIGKTTIDKLVLLANNHNVSIWEVIQKAEGYPMLGNSAKHVKKFGLMIESFISMVPNTNAYDLAMHVAKQTSLLSTLNADKTIEGVSRYEHVVELLNGIKEFVEDDSREEEKTLSNYLQDIALITTLDNDDENTDRVSMMTIHSSKGLEFPHVFLVGCEENLFPSQMALSSRSELEEERRLFYVAVTRAEKKLTLSFATSRFRFGNLLPCEPSRFIDEIDESCLDRTLLRKPLEKKDEGSFGKGFGVNTGSEKKKGFMPPKPIPPIINQNFEPEEITNLEVGDKIDHQRFGKGIVKEVDGEMDSRKAIIEFEDYGEKKLVLKFAKIRKVRTKS
jgi:DNA helicase-2/ATP-dependent DNA helicase PcrA